MENDNNKRGLILFLVVATVVIFIGLVWLIATQGAWNVSGAPSPTSVIAALRVKKNCTYPIAYWKSHPERFPSQIVIGSRLYRTDEIGEALSGEDQDPTLKVQAELMGVFLNILAGADQNLIDGTIFQAYGWIVEHPDGIQISDNDLLVGIRLFNLLESYNLGLAGIEACEDAASFISTFTATPTQGSTLLPTNTPSLTPTLTPSSTSSPTIEPTYLIWTVAVPTLTRIPTTEAPNNPPPTETQRPPAPTETPEPPTEEPAPTLTLAPLETTLPPPPP